MKVVTFGEIMLRLSPEGYLRFVQADRYNAVFGGAEANVAAALSNFGVETEFVTRLPKHELGQAAVNALRRYGVGSSHIVRGGERVGLYFLEKGASQRAGVVIYDRAGSAFSKSVHGDYDWARIFDGADIFHFTGITPALSPELADICAEAVRAAHAAGVTVFCDVNYRKKLWSLEAAQKTLVKLCAQADVCITNEAQAAEIFGVSVRSDYDRGMLDREGYCRVASQLSEKTGIPRVALTIRDSRSASDNDFGAMLYSGGACFFSSVRRLHIVDRVGGGDAFAAGLIFALGAGYGSQQAIDFAAAAGALKHSIEGDFNLVTVAEVAALAGGSASGQVQR